MRNTKNLLILVLSALVYCVANAGNVSEEIANTVAVNFMKMKLGKKMTINNTVTVDVAGSTIYGVNFKEGGWVLIPSTDKLKPILGYNTNGKFSVSDEKASPSNLMLKRYAKIVGKASSSQDFENFASEWDELLNPNNSFKKLLAGNRDGIIELIPFSRKWGQDRPFNQHCPIKTDGTGGKALVGCVPLAYAYIMSYYQWPYEFVDYEGNISKLNWHKLSDEAVYYSNEPNEAYTAQGQLSRYLRTIGHRGYASYSNKGVGMDPSSDGMLNFLDELGYTRPAVIYRDNLSKTQFIDILRSEIKAGRPVLYVGKEGDNHHAFVISGYDENTGKFYLCYGWSGENDGFYDLEANVDYIFDPGSNDYILIGMTPNYETKSSDFSVDNAGKNTQIKGNTIIYSYNRNAVNISNSDQISIQDEESSMEVISNKSITFSPGFSVQDGSLTAKVDNDAYFGHELIAEGVNFDENKRKISIKCQNANSWLLVCQKDDRKYYATSGLFGNPSVLNQLEIPLPQEMTDFNKYDYELYVFNNFGHFLCYRRWLNGPSRDYLVLDKYTNCNVFTNNGYTNLINKKLK